MYRGNTRNKKYNYSFFNYKPSYFCTVYKLTENFPTSIISQIPAIINRQKDKN